MWTEEQIRHMAKQILEAVENAHQYEWNEWDAFGGRNIPRQQPLRHAQLDAIADVLQTHNPKPNSKPH